MATQAIKDILDREIAPPSFSIVPKEANPSPGRGAFSRSSDAFSISAAGRKTSFASGEARSYREKQGLLLEPSRSQGLPNPNSFKNWTSRNLSVTGPGVNLGFDYYALNEDSTDGPHDIAEGVSGIGTGNSFTFTAIVRRESRDLCLVTQITDGTNTSLVDAFFDVDGKARGGVGSLSNGAVITHEVESLDGSWVRCIVSINPDPAWEVDKVYLRLANGSTAGDDIYAGDGSSRLLVRSAQVEAGPASTTHILTTGTRASEEVDLFSGGQADWWSPHEGTLIVTVTPLFYNATTIGDLVGASPTERHIYVNSSNFRVSDGDNKATLGPPTPHQKQRLLCSFDAQTIYAATNGSGASTPHNGSLLEVSSLTLAPPRLPVLVHSFQYIPEVVEGIAHAEALTV